MSPEQMRLTIIMSLLDKHPMFPPAEIVAKAKELEAYVFSYATVAKSNGGKTASEMADLMAQADALGVRA